MNYIVRFAAVTMLGLAAHEARSQSGKEPHPETAVRALPAGAQPDGSSSEELAAAAPESAVSAVEAVRRGNELLKSGEAPNALQWYDRAAELEPNAPQIPFVKGLGFYATGDYQAARRQFESAAASDDADLALDALYSIGTTYHAEALANRTDGKAAVENLEEAMRRYRAVLRDRPEFEPALDADRKAAQLRRMIREQLEQQPQQQSPSDSDQQESGEEDRSPSSPSESTSSPQENQNEQEPSESPESSSQEEPSEEPQSESQESSSQQDNPENSQESGESQADSREQQSSDSAEDSSQSQEPGAEESSSAQADDSQADESDEPSDARRNEEAAREQAERRLREMMQAQRERQERRRLAPPPPVRPVEKDW